MEKVLERFYSHIIDCTQERACWIWRVNNQNDYGYFTVDGKTFSAHRWIYEYYVGPIPQGYVIDHKCKTRRCVNVRHLEVVTVEENTRRGGETRAQRIVCRNGHEYTPETTRIINGGHRRCLICEKTMPSIKGELDAVLLRFFARVVDYSDENACWLWKNPAPIGYGFFTNSRKQYLAHRWIYRECFGEIPSGLVVDHLCNNRACVNPRHLEAVSSAENNRRARKLAVPRTACMRGHERVPENIWVRDNGEVVCKICSRMSHGSAPMPTTHCFRGHEYTKETLYIIPSTGYRKCWICHHMSIARRRGMKYFVFLDKVYEVLDA